MYVCTEFVLDSSTMQCICQACNGVPGMAKKVQEQLQVGLCILLLQQHPALPQEAQQLVDLTQLQASFVIFQQLYHPLSWCSGRAYISLTHLVHHLQSLRETIEGHEQGMSRLSWHG